MSASAAIGSCSWSVGPRTVTLTVPNPEHGGGAFMVAIEWAPDQPSRLTGSEWKEFRAGRQHALERLSAQLGISVAVLEL